MSAAEIIKQHYTEMGRKGGQRTSARKEKASRANLEKALRKRWGKPIKLRKRSREPG